MDDFQDEKYKLLQSLLLFTRVFYKLRTGREFVVSRPISREPHVITICKALTRAMKCGDIDKALVHFLINCPPRYGKTELVIHFIAWALALYPDSNFLYISYSKSLASKQTQTVRQIVHMPEYKELFGVQITRESSAKDNFETTAGGSVYAAGSAGTITGRGAGIQNCDRFGGAILIDDIHKPGEVTSDTMRGHVNDWYKSTLMSRVNSQKTPIIFIGQRLHEDDLPGKLMNGYDGSEWDKTILKAIDEIGNALNPGMHDINALLKMKEVSPYEFSAQYQQEPQPSGGGIFHEDWFVKLAEEPDIYYTFITADTAETAKTHNDATVFSFWGLYKIKDGEVETDIIGLHWIDAQECWVEPKDLKPEFERFYADCMRYRVKPSVAAIEKKSTGTTLLSLLSDKRGINIYDIERSRSSGSKTDRFLSCQSYVASKRISLPAYSKHTRACIDHMIKITANDSHRFDDIADTLSDAIHLTLIDNSIGGSYTSSHSVDLKIDAFAQNHANMNKMRTRLWHR
jgi:predicted phage terminase large subunit-like protein